MLNFHAMILSIIIAEYAVLLSRIPSFSPTYCLPKGRHSDGAHEFQGCSSQKCSRGGGGVGWVM